MNYPNVTISNGTDAVTITADQAALLILALWDSVAYHEAAGRPASAQAARDVIAAIEPVTA